MRPFLKIHFLGLLAVFIGFFALPAAANTYYVDINSPNPTPPYTTWNTASTDIQSALNQTANGDLVLVNPGIYQSSGYTAPDGNSSCVVISNAITLQSVNGPGTTFIQGYQPAIYFYNSVRCVYMSTNATLFGFTLTNGEVSDNGGGIYCQSTACLVSNCVIVGNAAGNDGGGAYSGTLKNCVVMNDSASGDGVVGDGSGGGGAYSSKLVNCMIFDNYSLTSGGGAAESSIYSSMVISNFAGYSEGYGGGVYDCTNFSSVLADNYAETEGGGAYGGILVNCTITKNSAYDGGGTEFCIQTNCIIYYNQIFYNDSSGTNVVGGSCSYCCTTPTPNSGTKCITSDPQLASISHISLNSPCRGAGNPAVTSGTDIDGNPWANPPSIGCSEPYPGNDFGSLTVGISVPLTNWAPGYALNFQANISGPVYSNVWNLGDGTFITNQAYVSHTWSTTGIYTVTLTAYNDSYPTGVTAALPVTIAVPSVYYVNLNSPNPNLPYIPEGVGPYEFFNTPSPVPPYITWGSAAGDIQDAVSVATPGSVVLVTNGPTWSTSPYNITNSAAFYLNGGTVAPNGYFYRVVVTNPITVESVNGPATTYIWGTDPGGSAAGCVYLTNGAILSGFTLTNGTSSSAAGVYCVSTNAVITNCLVAHCAGVYLGTFYNCGFVGNTAGAGGSTMFDCVISNNSSHLGGGAVGGILNYCLIVSNTAGYGGGVYCQSGSPAVLNNCIISNNSAQYGGGVYNMTSATNCILNNCTVTRNSANGVDYGGGAYNAELNNCLISNNYAGDGGGVCGGILTNCVIVSNSVAAYGGGVFAGTVINNPFLSCLLNDCIINNNKANEGGGVGNNNGSSTNCVLYNCTLTGNSASQYGGGAFNAQLNNCLVSSNQVIPNYDFCAGGGVEGGSLNNCILIGNSVTNPFSGGVGMGGGADGYILTHTVLTNCVLIANTALQGGGASSFTLVNCTVVYNSASQTGGGIAGCIADNCILYYNTGGDYGVHTGVFPILTNDINFCCTALMPTNGSRNITNAPLFVNAAAGNFQLQPNSPCINSGNNAYISVSTDLAGNPRIVGGTVDIGAYEYQTPTSVISYAWLQQYGLPTDGSVDYADLNGTAFNVYQDWVASLNPTNSASVLAMLIPTATNNASGITVTWQSVSGISYNILRSTNLPAFVTIQSNITGQTNTTSYADTSATNNFSYFYRVGVLVP